MKICIIWHILSLTKFLLKYLKRCFLCLLMNKTTNSQWWPFLMKHLASNLLETTKNFNKKLFTWPLYMRSYEWFWIWNRLQNYFLVINHHILRQVTCYLHEIRFCSKEVRLFFFHLHLQTFEWILLTYNYWIDRIIKFHWFYLYSIKLFSWKRSFTWSCIIDFSSKFLTGLCLIIS